MTDKQKVVPIADETLTLFDAAQEMAGQQKLERPFSVPGLRIGTSAFMSCLLTARDTGSTDWENHFAVDIRDLWPSD